MLQLLYILAFTCIAFLAVSSIIRNLISLSAQPQRRSPTSKPSSRTAVAHPELLDAQGKPIEEPLLVMRSVNVDEARQKLDAIFDASPNHRPEASDEL